MILYLHDIIFTLILYLHCIIFTYYIIFTLYYIYLILYLHYMINEITRNYYNEARRSVKKLVDATCLCLCILYVHYPIILFV